MKTNDKKALHTKTIVELQQMIAEAKQALFTAKIEKSQMKLKDTSSIARKQDDIARMLTILRTKEMKNENA